MRTKMLIRCLLMAAMVAGPAWSQSGSDAATSRSFPADPRDRFDPRPKISSPNRIAPSLGRSTDPTAGDGAAVTNGAPGTAPPQTAPSQSAVVAPVQRELPPGSAETLTSMGGMQLYQPPSTAPADAQFATLPGMDVYTPPSPDGDPVGYNGYPAWWPQ